MCEGNTKKGRENKGIIRSYHIPSSTPAINVAWLDFLGEDCCGENCVFLFGDCHGVLAPLFGDDGVLGLVTQLAMLCKTSGL